jgi:16S rRNA (guanine966-N2)-methyltransferase
MQVTTGKAKGHKLLSVPGDGTRPITDMAKQALFNILGGEVQDSLWLDLFAGTGAVGIEALSRGASSVTFIDRAAAAIETIHKNLTSTKLKTSASVLKQDAFGYINSGPSTKYDYIYIAPPQWQNLWSKALLALDKIPGWLSETGTIIVQIAPSEFEEHALSNLDLVEQRKYGQTLLCFYERTAGIA